MNKMELLAPAGNLEKFKMAIIYGADAVYIGGNKFGLRAYAGNFSEEEMIAGIEYAHLRGKRVYVTVNIFAHNDDLEGLDEYIKTLKRIGVDAVIASDPGIFDIVREVEPEMEVHLSTQANTTNYRSSKFWHDRGVKRIVLARELSFEEIKTIREKTSESLELEAFVHGAMCISYSGRCLLSNYMISRDSNKGECAQPCRWNYHLVEEKRPGVYIPVEEEERGTYIFNSRDLCMLPYLKELQDAGIKSLKIEGRMKSSYYVATVVKAYRMALDSLYANGENYKFNPMWLEEVSKASHREFTTGFYLGKTTDESQVYGTSSYVRNYDFAGIVLDYDEENKMVKVEQRNRLYKGQEVELMPPNGDFITTTIETMWDENMNEIDVTPHAKMIYYFKLDRGVPQNTIVRRAL